VPDRDEKTLPLVRIDLMAGKPAHFHYRACLDDHQLVEHPPFVGRAQFAERVGIQHEVVANLKVADESADDLVLLGTPRAPV